MEGALEQMASTFLDFTNSILQSPSVGRDPALMSKLRSATDSILYLCQGSNEVIDSSETCQKDTAGSQAAGCSASDDAEFQQKPRGNGNRNGELPQTKTALDSTFLDFHSLSQSAPALQSGNVVSTSQRNPFVKPPPEPEPIGNIFGNGFRNLPPINFTDCAAKAENILQIYPSEDSLSIIVTRASLQHAYDVILSDTQMTTPMVDRIFGFPLKFRSREEILMVLRWYLSPQTCELSRLATATFDDYLVAQYYHGVVTSQYAGVDGVFRGSVRDLMDRDSPPPMPSRILNAYQIEQWLLACGMKYLDCDTIELTDVKPTGLLLDSKPPDSPSNLLASFAALAQQSTLQDDSPPAAAQEATGHNTGERSIARNIRLSRSRLIHVLVGISFCIDKGPAFTEKALLEAVATAMVAHS